MLVSTANIDAWPTLPGRGTGESAFTPPLKLVGTIPTLVDGQPFDFELTITGGVPPYDPPTSPNEPAFVTISVGSANDKVRFQGIADHS